MTIIWIQLNYWRLYFDPRQQNQIMLWVYWCQTLPLQNILVMEKVKKTWAVAKISMQNNWSVNLKSKGKKQFLKGDNLHFYTRFLLNVFVL